LPAQKSDHHHLIITY